MSERNDQPSSERATTSTKFRMTEPTLRQGAEPTDGSRSGQHPALVVTTPLVAQSAECAGSTPLAWETPSRNNHLARLIDAVQKSRRRQTPAARRRNFHLVSGDRT